MDGTWHEQTPWFLGTQATDMEPADVLTTHVANTTIRNPLAQEVPVHLCVPGASHS